MNRIQTITAALVTLFAAATPACVAGPVDSDDPGDTPSEDVASAQQAQSRPGYSLGPTTWKMGSAGFPVSQMLNCNDVYPNGVVRAWQLRELNKRDFRFSREWCRDMLDNGTLGPDNTPSITSSTTATAHRACPRSRWTSCPSACASRPDGSWPRTSRSATSSTPAAAGDCHSAQPPSAAPRTRSPARALLDRLADERSREASLLGRHLRAIEAEVELLPERAVLAHDDEAAIRARDLEKAAKHDLRCLAFVLREDELLRDLVKRAVRIHGGRASYPDRIPTGANPV